MHFLSALMPGKNLTTFQFCPLLLEYEIYWHSVTFFVHSISTFCTGLFVLLNYSNQSDFYHVYIKTINRMHKIKWGPFISGKNKQFPSLIHSTDLTAVIKKIRYTTKTPA